jgi:hypothetical protein
MAVLSKDWLQKNRIDAVRQRLSVGHMKLVKAQESKCLVPFPCESCGGLMHLVGSEPHPVEAKVDLLTFNCTACSAVQVSRVEIPTPEV